MINKAAALKVIGKDAMATAWWGRREAGVWVSQALSLQGQGPALNGTRVKISLKQLCWLAV